ncbi:MAG TPA: DNA recombination protein RmuC [Acidimicrobiales bacterium]|nr:DNA recombination protein RmuC [Acidimicrobiales bacterium]
MDTGTLLAALVATALVGAVAGAVLVRRWAPTADAGEDEAVEASLRRVEERLTELEASRREAHAGLVEQMRSMREAQELLRGETAMLGRSLRSPTSRGRWGEIQLRRVVELAGMIDHCDFVEQPALDTEVDEAGARPDLVIRLPGDRYVVVDAKVPLDSYLNAMEEVDERRRRQLRAEHGRALRAHVSSLSAKAYWARLPASPEFVVAFLPGDALLAAALDSDPALIDFAVGRQVLLATPMTLIAMLRSIAYGWRQDALVDNARAVCQAGQELHRRLGVMADHLATVGRSLERAADSYNKAVGSLDSRVLVTARRLADLGAGDEPIDAPPPVATALRRPSGSATG